MPEFTLHPIDIGIILAYGLIVVLIGLKLAKKHETAEDYFLAGRSMAWPLIGVSLFASNISSTTLVGLAGDAYSTGISVFNYEWMAAVVLVFFAIFLLPFYLRSKLFTMPEFLEKRFDGRARSIFSVLTLFLNIVVDTAGSLYAGGLLMALIFPEIPMWQTIAIMAVLAGAYTIAGGLAAVIYTDAIQTVLLLVGSVIITVAGILKIGGWSEVTAATPPEMLSLVRPLDDPGVPWLGLLTGVPLLGFYFWCTNQFMVQRALSAKNLTHGRLGVLLAGFLKLPVLLIMVLPGTMARLLYPELANPDMVYPTMIFDLLPVGLLGIVLAGFVAALMSQIDSTLNSASTLITMDFVSKYKANLTSEQLMWVGRGFTAIFMVLAALWAPQIENFSSLFKYLQKILSYTIPPVVALFLVGIFWKKANAPAAFITLISGLVFGVLSFLTIEVFHLIEIHFLYTATLLFLIALVILVTTSLLSGAGDTTSDMIWTRAFFHAETLELREQPWYLNYRYYSVVLLALATILVISFW
jgi:SSS family solute:Na+ symporter